MLCGARRSGWVKLPVGERGWKRATDTKRARLSVCLSYYLSVSLSERMAIAGLWEGHGKALEMGSWPSQDLPPPFAMVEGEDEALNEGRQILALSRPSTYLPRRGWSSGWGKKRSFLGKKKKTSSLGKKKKIEDEALSGEEEEFSVEEGRKKMKLSLCGKALGKKRMGEEK